MSNLHDQIINLAVGNGAVFYYDITERAYREGHKDARHQAAELVAAHQAEPDKKGASPCIIVWSVTVMAVSAIGLLFLAFSVATGQTALLDYYFEFCLKHPTIGFCIVLFAPIVLPIPIGILTHRYVCTWDKEPL